MDMDTQIAIVISSVVVVLLLYSFIYSKYIYPVRDVRPPAPAAKRYTITTHTKHNKVYIKDFTSEPEYCDVLHRWFEDSEADIAKCCARNGVDYSTDEGELYIPSHNINTVTVKMLK